jgi:hypothetical protein
VVVGVTVAAAYPPTRVKNWEAQVVHDPVAVSVAVAHDLDAHREALDT